VLLFLVLWVAGYHRHSNSNKTWWWVSSCCCCKQQQQQQQQQQCERKRRRRRCRTRSASTVAKGRADDNFNVIIIELGVSTRSECSSFSEAAVEWPPYVSCNDGDDEESNSGSSSNPTVNDRNDGASMRSHRSASSLSSNQSSSNDDDDSSSRDSTKLSTYDDTDTTGDDTFRVCSRWRRAIILEQASCDRSGWVALCSTRTILPLLLGVVTEERP